ncbi:transposase, partial [Tetragenococcus koreensis]
MKLFVGIDVSSEKLDTCYLTDEMVVLLNHTYGNDTQGAWKLKEQVLAFYETYSFDQIVIGMESTSMYSYHPAV